MKSTMKEGKTLYFKVMEWVVFILTSMKRGFILLLNWCWFNRHNLPPGTKLPPMPPTSSIFGHLELKHHNFHYVKALHWAKEYGPVFRLRSYFRSIVVLNDIDSIKKFSVNNQVLDRPEIMNFGGGSYKGLLIMNGKVWRDNRSFCMWTLRDLGFGKSVVEDKLTVEFRKVEEEIDKAEGKAVYLGLQFMECAGNQLASFFMPRIQSDRRVRDQLNAALAPVFVLLQTMHHYYFWPRICQAVVSFFPFTNIFKMNNAIKNFDNFIINEISNHVEDSGQKTFIQTYKEKVDESTKNQDYTYQNRYLVGHIKMFLIGGIDGPSISMQMHMVMFAVRPNDLQRRVQREIDAVIGHRRLPTWDDRKLMPFTMACVWELERWKRTEPFGLPRGTEKDVVVDNILIPGGSVVLFNLWAVNRDPSLWKNPHHYDPTRFLCEDGSLIREKPSYHVGFSFGKRSCPGEPFALMQIFLMVTYTLQRYDVELGEPLTCDLDDPAINLRVLKKTKLRFERRFKNKITCNGVH
ncbi:putative cytochrome P450 2D7 [Rhipicephalus sanguineus]|uniref:putative cytochrome P450 2D7 n=1 Tax=Rhipicephalus sanguineus TaxID=34632 RepID=UPI001892FA9D|nr:putative cytochrome P450 2D7 [Rhipicephalus sanguineus]